MVIEKTCTRCGVPQPADLEHFPKKKKNSAVLSSWCRKCYRTRTGAWNAANSGRKADAARAYRQNESTEYKERQRLRYARLSLDQKTRRRDIARRRNEKLKREALEHYGGAICCCCGETEILMLALDHIGNNGAEHRKSLTGTTRKLPTVSYIWAKKNNWPPIFQVTCFNCNWARHWNNGVCPHKEQIRWDNIALKSQQSVATAASATSAKVKPWETAAILPALTALPVGSLMS